MTALHRTLALALLATLAAGGSARAQTAAAPLRTLELNAVHSQLTGGQADGWGTRLRGVWDFRDGQVAGLELLDESKFGARGGVVAASYTRSFGPDMYAIGTLALGRGGPNWARRRFDLDIATKWGATRHIVTHLAINGAQYDQHRSDSGVRAAVVAYLAGPTVLEGGVLLNLSHPGSVGSHMPYASVTWGREGWQVVALRVASGTEAYQALGAGGQLVDFRSRSVALNWRRWVDSHWGLVLAAEHYRNPSYQRSTASAGLLMQF